MLGIQSPFSSFIHPQTHEGRCVASFMPALYTSSSTLCTHIQVLCKLRCPCPQLSVCVTVERNVLNDYIRHYEGLTYDVRSLRHSHGRVRRSLDSSVRLSFHAHGRSVHVFAFPS